MKIYEYYIYVKGIITLGHVKALRQWIQDFQISSFEIKHITTEYISIKCPKQTAKKIFKEGREDYLCWISGMEKIEVKPIFMYMWSSEEEE